MSARWSSSMLKLNTHPPIVRSAFGFILLINVWVGVKTTAGVGDFEMRSVHINHALVDGKTAA